MTTELYVRECNRLEIERDEARRTVREAHEAGARVTAQRDALLEALNSFLYEFGDKANSATVQKARAAIKAVDNSIFNWQQE